MNKTVLLISVIILMCITIAWPESHAWTHFAAMIALTILAYNEYKLHHKIMTIIFTLLAILFQPYIKFNLTTGEWNATHVSTSFILAVIWINEKRHRGGDFWKIKKGKTYQRNKRKEVSKTLGSNSNTNNGDTTTDNIQYNKKHNEISELQNTKEQFGYFFALYDIIQPYSRHRHSELIKDNFTP